jgi:tetratricopeptide (TPR) repeat protein
VTPGWKLLRYGLVLAALSGCKKKPPKPAPDEAAAGIEATTPTVAPVEEAPAARVDRAVALMTSGKRDDVVAARDLLLKLSESAPDDAAARLNLGVAWYRLGEMEQAAAEFSRLTRTRPDLARGWLYLAMTEVELGDEDAAVRHLRAGIEAAPADAELRVGLISTLRKLARYDEAVAAATEALRVNAKSLPVYDEMGQAWLDQNQPDRARFVYEKASTITGADANPAIQSGFGQVLFAKGERYAAEARLKKALELDPDNLRALVLLGRMYEDDRAWTTALPLLERAALLDPQNHGVAVDLGTAYRGVGRLDDAEAQWRRALQLDPKDPTPHFNLGVLAGDDRKATSDGIAAMKAYLAAGGADQALGQSYIDAWQKESERSAARRKQEEERARREKERAERERILKEAEANPPPAEGPPPGEPAPTSPWGPQPEGGGG